MNCAVEPEPSECTTATIGIDGNALPFMSRVIAGSFQLVIWLVKIFARVSPESRRLRDQLAGDLELVGERGTTGDDREVDEVAAGRRIVGTWQFESESWVTLSTPW